MQGLLDRVRCAAFVPVTGGGRRRVFVYGRTRNEVRDKRDDLQRAETAGLPRPRKRQTVSEYLDYWLEHVVKPERRNDISRLRDNGAIAHQAGARAQAS
jgi:hypothetical protein